VKRNGAGISRLCFHYEIHIYLIGEGITNRRLLGRKVGWDWNEKFRILADFGEKIKTETSNSPLCGREKNWKNDERLIWSKILNDVRTFFQENS